VRGTGSASPMRAHRFVLAIDLGTGGPKVGLVSLIGEIAWKNHTAVETHYLSGGGAVQDAEEWWQIVRNATRQAMTSGAVPDSQIVAVSITGQWGSTVPVDAKGCPVSECVMWMDDRGRRHSKRAFGWFFGGPAPRAAATWIRRCGVPPSIYGDDPVGHMLYLERDRPTVARAARWYLEAVDYLSMRFTGVASASPSSMMAACLTDTRRNKVVDYDPVLVRLSGVNAVKLPPLRQTGSLIGQVRKEVATDLGIPIGTPVVSPIPDVHSSAIGAGAALECQAHIAISTTSWISCPVSKRRANLRDQIVSVPGLSAGSYILVNNQDNAGRCIEWLRDNIVDPLDQLSSGSSKRVSYEALAALAATAPPGSGNVIFTPWLSGEHAPIVDRNARGGFFNVSLASTRADLARSVLEGVAYNSRWLLRSVERLTKCRMDPIRLVGGGAQSDLWCQIVADILDRRIERVEEPLHASLRGAALFAGLALGEVNYEELRSLVNVDISFQPNPANRAVYDRIFAEFPQLYKTQRAMFVRLNSKPLPFNDADQTAEPMHPSNSTDS
jgi:xylulokinase